MNSNKSNAGSRKRKANFRTSRQKKDAKIRTAANELDFCRHFNAESASSCRTRAAVAATLLADDEMSQADIALRHEADEIRDAAILEQYSVIRVGQPKSLKKGHVMFTGGSWLPKIEGCRIIPAKDFDVVQPDSETKGVLCKRDGSPNPVFCLLPRRQTLLESGAGDVGYCNKLVRIIDDVTTRVQKRSIQRGCLVFCQGRYAGSFGATVPLGKPGVEEFSHHLVGLGERDYDFLVDYAARLDKLAVDHTRSSAVRFISDARDLVKYKVMKSSGGGASPTIFSSIGMGKNATLSAHIDSDFFFSLTTILLKDYDPVRDADRIIGYFVFPDARKSVALRHGDCLLFNPRVMHSISSRVEEKDTVYTLSLYIKTSNVSGNDNKRELSEDELKALSKYDVAYGK